jgi:outer membrane protein OmpA-like peptidoglycan-associated protein
MNKATYVGAFLIKNSIDGDRLTTTGFGPDQPIPPDDTEENRQMNRRVEVKILAR